MYKVNKDGETIYVCSNLHEANDYIDSIGGNVYDYDIEEGYISIDYEAEKKFRNYLICKITLMMDTKSTALDLEKEKQKLLICENKIRIVEDELKKKEGKIR